MPIIKKQDVMNHKEKTNLVHQEKLEHGKTNQTDEANHMSKM